MNKFYLVWSEEEPKHPKEVYKESWDSGLSWYGQINRTNKSLDDWKKEQIDRYESLMKEYQLYGRIKALRLAYHPTPEEIISIEKDKNFIEWCLHEENPNNTNIDKSKEAHNQLMPKYKCHKEVWAFKIKQIVPTVMIDEDGAKETGKIMIFPEEEGYQPFEVSKDFIEKHKPQVGGYYVQYKDGYESYSPADAFEEGYSKIEE